MKSRIIVAIIGIPLVYLATVAKWQDNLLFALFVTAVCIMATLEWCEMFRKYKPFVPAAVLVACITPFLAWSANEAGIFTALLASIPLVMIFASLSVERRNPAVSIAITLMAPLYICAAAGLIIVVRGTEHGLGLVLIMLAGQWINDSAAFFAGRTFGKHKLAPRISPNKSIEGLIAGLIAGTAAVWFMGTYMTDKWMTSEQALILGVTVALAVPVGDLFESMLKRAAGVKDSGTLLGDHGGVLDRIDALLLAGPMVYVVTFFLGEL